jgi:hypothetical protein
MKILLALSTILWIGGCTRSPQTVYVPVPCPQPPLVARPSLPIQTLQPGDSVERERILWWATVEALMGYSKTLETLLDGYRSKPEETK